MNLCKGYYLPSHVETVKLSPEREAELREMASRENAPPELEISETASKTSPVKGIKKKFSAKNFKDKLPNGKSRMIKTPVILWAIVFLDQHNEVSVFHSDGKFKKKTISQALSKMCMCGYIEKTGKIGACTYYKKGELYDLL